MLPVLGALDRYYDGRPVQVLGVHTSKFPAEQDPERILDAMRRMHVSHPVLVDADKRVWEQFGVRAWPTLFLVGPDGAIEGTYPGELRYEFLVDEIDELLSKADKLGLLEPAVGRRTTVDQPDHQSYLSYPGKAEATPHGLAIADSAHHRIVLTSNRSDTAQIVGSGVSGLRDGPASEARFNGPQGLAFNDGRLYVADAGNHAIRAIDLGSLEVSTLVGDGILGSSVPQDLTDAREVRLRSPWDLAFGNGILLIAMAGTHQIWAYIPESKQVTVLAGTGREGLDDGLLHEASFSQPTGLDWRAGRLLVADSEASAVRIVDLGSARVRTLIGKGLFEFGDRDGDKESARLQHVQDVCSGPHGILIADTYNDKIRHVSDSGEVTTWLGKLEGGLREPSGILQLTGGQVIVADTHNHRIVVIDGTSKDVKTLPLS